MKLLSLAICAITVAFLLTSVSVIANHNSTESRKARVSAVGILQIDSVATATTISDSDIDPEDGEAVYDNTCAICHDSGVAGAPVLGETEDWAERIEQGLDTLIEHAIQGFTGASGVMPAKGGNATLSDNAITVAVEFMVDQVE